MTTDAVRTTMRPTGRGSSPSSGSSRRSGRREEKASTSEIPPSGVRWMATAGESTSIRPKDWPERTRRASPPETTTRSTSRTRRPRRSWTRTPRASAGVNQPRDSSSISTRPWIRSLTSERIARRTGPVATMYGAAATRAISSTRTTATRRSQRRFLRGRASPPVDAGMPFLSDAPAMALPSVAIIRRVRGDSRQSPPRQRGATPSATARR